MTTNARPLRLRAHRVVRAVRFAVTIPLLGPECAAGERSHCAAEGLASGRFPARSRRSAAGKRTPSGRAGTQFLQSRA